MVSDIGWAFIGAETGKCTILAYLSCMAFCSGSTTSADSLTPIYWHQVRINDGSERQFLWPGCAITTGTEGSEYYCDVKGAGRTRALVIADRFNEKMRFPVRTFTLFNWDPLLGTHL